MDGQAAEIETTYPVHKPGSAADATILTSIQHPECIIDDYKGQAGDWLASDKTNNYNLLWGDNNTTYVFNKSKPAAGKDGQTAKPSTTRVRPVTEFPANLHGLDSVARHPEIQKI